MSCNIPKICSTLLYLPKFETNCPNYLPIKDDRLGGVWITVLNDEEIAVRALLPEPATFEINRPSLPLENWIATICTHWKVLKKQKSFLSASLDSTTRGGRAEEPKDPNGVRTVHVAQFYSRQFRTLLTFQGFRPLPGPWTPGCQYSSCLPHFFVIWVPYLFK